MGSANSGLLIMIMLFLFISTTTEQDDCIDQRCGQHGPEIRFPFRLEGLQPQRCGYSRSFDLSCSKDNQTLFQLPTSAKFLVKKIDYKTQTIHLADPDACLPKLIRNVVKIVSNLCSVKCWQIHRRSIVGTSRSIADICTKSHRAIADRS